MNDAEQTKTTKLPTPLQDAIAAVLRRPDELEALKWLPVDGSHLIVSGLDQAVALCNLEEKGLAASDMPGSRELPLRWHITDAGRKAREVIASPCGRLDGVSGT